MAISSKLHKATGVVLMILLAGLESNGRAASLELRGLAVYTETARDIYLAGMSLPEGTTLDNVYLAPGPKAMDYRIATRRISVRGFFGTLLLQAELGSGERAPEQVITTIADLKQKIQGALVYGDQFQIMLSEDDATSFHLNGSELMTVTDGEIFDFFFAGWVGESSSTLLRDTLLSNKL